MKVKRPRRRRREHEVERIIPSDAAEYLEPRPNAAAYDSPLIFEGVEVMTNSPKAFHKPRPWEEAKRAWSDARRDGKIGT